MQARNVVYWFKNILGFAMVIAGAILLLFFKESTFHQEFLKQFHNQIGFGLFSLGAVVIAGLENIARVIVGLVIIAIGAFGMSYFTPLRNTWIGQLITNFIAPATMLGGILVMVLFGNDLNAKKRRG